MVNIIPITATERAVFMARNSKIAIALAAVVFLIMLGIGGFGLYQKKNHIKEMDALWKKEHSADSQFDQVNQEDALFSGNEVTWKGKKYRRNTYVKAILFLGIDRTGTLQSTQVAGSGGQSDAVILIAQDTARDTVKFLMIPRDTITDIILTDLAGNELAWGSQHINLAFAYGDGREKSCSYASRAVSKMFSGLPIDGCLAVGMDLLPKINDSVGGVTVPIKEQDLVERLKKENPGIFIGDTVLLKGKEAETYLRYRDTTKNQTALLRQERQKQYIEAFALAVKQQAKKENGFTERIWKMTEPYLVTDLKKDQLLDMLMAFVKSSQKFSDEDMLTLSGTGVETEMFDEYHMDRDAAYEQVLTLFFREE